MCAHMRVVHRIELAELGCLMTVRDRRYTWHLRSTRCWERVYAIGREAVARVGSKETVGPSARQLKLAVPALRSPELRLHHFPRPLAPRSPDGPPSSCDRQAGPRSLARRRLVPLCATTKILILLVRRQRCVLPLDPPRSLPDALSPFELRTTQGCAPSAPHCSSA